MGNGTWMNTDAMVSWSIDGYNFFIRVEATPDFLFYTRIIRAIIKNGSNILIFILWF